MVFNFYINQDSKTERNEEMEAIMKDMETHFANWNDFYDLYMKHATPPKKFQKQIQNFFNDLREDFVKMLKQYNEKIHHFADIHETDTNDNFEDQVIEQMKEMAKASQTKETKTDSNLNMYN